MIIMDHTEEFCPVRLCQYKCSFEQVLSHMVRVHEEKNIHQKVCLECCYLYPDSYGAIEHQLLHLLGMASCELPVPKMRSKVDLQLATKAFFRGCRTIWWNHLKLVEVHSTPKRKDFYFYPTQLSEMYVELWKKYARPDAIAKPMRCNQLHCAFIGTFTDILVHLKEQHEVHNISYFGCLACFELYQDSVSGVEHVLNHLKDLIVFYQHRTDDSHFHEIANSLLADYRVTNLPSLFAGEFATEGTFDDPTNVDFQFPLHDCERAAKEDSWKLSLTKQIKQEPPDC